MSDIINPAPKDIPPNDVKRTDADFLRDPAVKSAFSSSSWLHGDPKVTDLAQVTASLTRTVAEIQGGDMRPAEKMLVSQADTLDALFHVLLRKTLTGVISCRADAPDYLRLAFKAQSQARLTWETIAKLKNPSPVMFARQVNQTSGPQQINNCCVRCAAAIEIPIAPNELMEVKRGERMDP